MMCAREACEMRRQLVCHALWGAILVGCGSAPFVSPDRDVNGSGGPVLTPLHRHDRAVLVVRRIESSNLSEHLCKVGVAFSPDSRVCLATSDSRLWVLRLAGEGGAGSWGNDWTLVEHNLGQGLRRIATGRSGREFIAFDGAYLWLLSGDRFSKCCPVELDADQSAIVDSAKLFSNSVVIGWRGAFDYSIDKGRAVTLSRGNYLGGTAVSDGKVLAVESQSGDPVGLDARVVCVSSGELVPLAEARGLRAVGSAPDNRVFGLKSGVLVQIADWDGSTTKVMHDTNRWYRMAVTNEGVIVVARGKCSLVSFDGVQRDVAQIWPPDAMDVRLLASPDGTSVAVSQTRVVASDLNGVHVIESIVVWTLTELMSGS